MLLIEESAGRKKGQLRAMSGHNCPHCNAQFNGNLTKNKSFLVRSLLCLVTLLLFYYPLLVVNLLVYKIKMICTKNYTSEKNGRLCTI